MCKTHINPYKTHSTQEWQDTDWIKNDRNPQLIFRLFDVHK